MSFDSALEGFFLRTGCLDEAAGSADGATSGTTAAGAADAFFADFLTELLETDAFFSILWVLEGAAVLEVTGYFFDSFLAGLEVAVDLGVAFGLGEVAGFGEAVGGITGFVYLAPGLDGAFWVAGAFVGFGDTLLDSFFSGLEAELEVVDLTASLGSFWIALVFVYVERLILRGNKIESACFYNFYRSSFLFWNASSVSFK